MTELFDALLGLQQHDTTLDQLRRSLTTLPERAELRAVEEEQRTLRAATSEVQAAIDDLGSRQRALEERIATTAGRRHEIETRMESGEVTASRELQAMDNEVHHLEERQLRFEQEELALVEEEDPLDETLAALRASLDLLDAEADRLATAVDAAERRIRGSVAGEEDLRRELASRLPVELVATYEAIRSRMGGVGAARLLGDRCDGCHLTLSAVDLERIRHRPPDELVTCTQCDRILIR